jgi:hypothetical protein
MKNILLIILFSVLSFGASSQIFIPTPRNATSSGLNNASVDLIITIKNNSSNIADSMFKWTVLSNNVPVTWDFGFCDPNNCYPASEAVLGKNHVCQINKGANGQMKASYSYNNSGGTSFTKIVLQSFRRNATNTADSITFSDTISFNASAWMTGVNQVNRSSEIDFYPNPVKDQLNFKYASNSSITVDIYNIIGVKVKSFTHDGNTTLVNTNDLQNGVYFLRVKDGANSFSKQFVKSE